MKLNTNKKLWIFLLFGGIGFLSIALNVFVLTSQQKVAYVNLTEVFDGFIGKKSMEAKFMSMSNQRRQTLDSIALQIKMIEKNIKDVRKENEALNQLNFRKAQFAKLTNDFTSQSQEEDQEFSNRIWTQINQYTEDYGDENGYDFIYGVSGNGVLMYGKPEKNITEDLIKYLNNKYEGL